MRKSDPHVSFATLTADAPGAIAIVQVQGDALDALIEQLTGKPVPLRAALAHFADIDQGLIVPLPGGAVQLMPHGGPRVMQRLTEKLLDLGAVHQPHLPARALYPEAATDLEADMLDTLARAASPAAIDRLLDQPRRWRDWLASKVGSEQSEEPNHLLHHADRIDQLITPPTVVLIGQPNVGKSTLSNHAAGRALSLTADLPGTTRDWVAGLAELPTPFGELAVRWFDTPGLRRSDDPIEQRAIELSSRVIESADLLIATADPETDFPDTAALPRQPDLYVMNKSDLLDTAPPTQASSSCLLISALTGDGFDTLAAAIADRLGLAGIDPDRPWAFCPELRRLLADHDHDTLARYIGEAFPSPGKNLN